MKKKIKKKIDLKITIGPYCKSSGVEPTK